MPTFHTKRSPSQAKRFLACSGTFALCDTLPEEHRNISTPAAQLGTAAHGLNERCLGEGSNPEDYRDRIIELVGDEESVRIHRANAKVPGPGKVFFIVDNDMIDGAELHCTYVRQRCKELGIPESAIQLETRTNPLPDREHDDTSGTADVTLDAWPTMLEVVDYKNGWNVVEHEDNEQLLAYLLGKALETDLSHESYRVTVTQPNAPHAEGRVRSFDATREELLEFQARYRKGIERCETAEEAFRKINDPKSKVFDAWAKTYLKAGDHCLFCEAQAICPARIALAQKQAAVDFEEEPETLELRPNMESAVNILKWADSLDSLIRAATNYVQRELEGGHGKGCGFKLVRGRSTRKLRQDVPEPKLVAAIIKGGFVKAKAKLYTPPKLLSGPQIEKLVPKKLREKFNAEFLTKPEGALTLARDDDPRAAVVVNPGDDFADDDNDELDFG